MREKDITVEKIPGKENWSDALAKPVDGNTLDWHRKQLGFDMREGRHELMPKVDMAEQRRSDGLESTGLAEVPWESRSSTYPSEDQKTYERAIEDMRLLMRELDGKIAQAYKQLIGRVNESRGRTQCRGPLA